MDKCENHDTTHALIQDIRNDLKWHNAIGKGLFVLGVALVTLAISSLVYFGKIDERVSHLYNYSTVMDVRMNEESQKVQGQIQRVQARIRDLERSKHEHKGDITR